MRAKFPWKVLSMYFSSKVWKNSTAAIVHIVLTYLTFILCMFNIIRIKYPLQMRQTDAYICTWIKKRYILTAAEFFHILIDCCHWELEDPVKPIQVTIVGGIFVKPCTWILLSVFFVLNTWMQLHAVKITSPNCAPVSSGLNQTSYPTPLKCKAVFIKLDLKKYWYISWNFKSG